MPKPPNPGGKSQKILVVDGEIDVTPEQEETTIQDYIDQGFELLFIRSVPLNLKCVAAINPVTEIISCPRYYFLGDKNISVGDE